MKGCQCGMAKLCGVLVIVGALNWGLVGVGMFTGGGYNLVHMILGSWSKVEAAVYVLVGLAAIMKIIGCRCAKCKTCQAGAVASGASKM